MQTTCTGWEGLVPHAPVLEGDDPREGEVRVLVDVPGHRLRKKTGAATRLDFLFGRSKFRLRVSQRRSRSRGDAPAPWPEPNPLLRKDAKTFPPPSN